MTGPDLSGIEPPSRVGIPTLRPSPDARDELLVAPNIPRYRIIRQLGIGGMGAVWEAEQQLTRRVVALKVIRPGWVSTPLLRRFEHEVELLGRLQHPGIAQIFEAGTADAGSGPQPFFAMELINGLRLDEWAARTKPALPKRLEMLTRICDAVQYAHQKGVIHRDLKPGNILVDESGQPKILDFGVARAIDSDVKATSINTSTGQIIGTLQYMSPEQASGEAPHVDTRSDVYALGVIAYELMADRLPYDLQGKPLPEAIRVIREEQRPRLSEIDRTFRGDLETIVGKALERERDRRYGSASEMGADIRHFLNYEPISARPPSSWYQLSKFARRNKLLVGGVAVLFLVLLAGVVTTSFQWYRARRAEQLAQRRFDDVRALANTFMLDFYSKIESLPGSTPALKSLVETSLKYLDKLSAEAQYDPKLLRELSIAYARMGDIQGNPNYNNLGDTSAALASYGRSLQITERLLTSTPSQPMLHHDLVTTQLRIGDVLSRTGDFNAALDNCGHALRAAEALARISPADDTTALTDMVDVHSAMGNILGIVGKYQSALDAHRKAEQFATRLVTAAPDDPRWEQKLTTAATNVGKMLATTGDMDAGLAKYQEVLEWRKRAAQRDPRNARKQMFLSFSYLQVAALQGLRGEYQAALPNTLTGLEIRKRLAAADPTNAQAQRHLLLAYDDAGKMSLGAGDAASAVEHHQRAVDLARELARVDPNDAEAQRDLAASNQSLGRSNLAMGNDARLTPAQRAQYAQRSRDCFDAALELILQLKSSGKLGESDTDLPSQLLRQRAQANQLVNEAQNAAAQPK